jgi:hypothetical protein
VKALKIDGSCATEKWIEGVAAGDRTGDVALRALRIRLGAVLELLPLAAEKAEEDTEHIHQLRVWTRRAVAALELYEDLLPRRRTSWMKKQFAGRPMMPAIATY